VLGTIAGEAGLSSFFTGRRTDPARAHRFVERVAFQPQPLRDFGFPHAGIEELLDLGHHRLDQDRRPARGAWGIKPGRPLLSIQLHGTLHADARHPKGPHDVGLLGIAVHAELTGDHPEGRLVILLMNEHRHVPVEIRHPPVLLHKGQLRGDVGDTLREERQLALWHRGDLLEEFQGV
jgi:hypothetical protein